MHVEVVTNDFLLFHKFVWFVKFQVVLITLQVIVSHNYNNNNLLDIQGERNVVKSQDNWHLLSVWGSCGSVGRVVFLWSGGCRFNSRFLLQHVNVPLGKALNLKMPTDLHISVRIGESRMIGKALNKFGLFIFLHISIWNIFC